jgi:hypothetical protein
MQSKKRSTTSKPQLQQKNVIQPSKANIQDIKSKQEEVETKSIFKTIGSKLLCFIRLFFYLIIISKVSILLSNS